MTYLDAYAERGGHPKLFADEARDVLAAINELANHVHDRTHPETRVFVRAKLNEAFGVLAEVVTKEAAREGDDYRRAADSQPMLCPVCRGRGLVVSGEGTDPCISCDSEGVLRAGAR